MSLFLGSVETYDAPICGCKDFWPICRKAVLATLLTMSGCIG